jgi:hypothetical protein
LSGIQRVWEPDAENAGAANASLAAVVAAA